MEIPDKKMDELFEQATELVGYESQSLGAMALLAHQHLGNRKALKVLTLAYGRDARHMARAVELFPVHFEANALAGLLPGRLLSLFALARLPEHAATSLYGRMMDMNMNLFEVNEMIARDALSRKAKATAHPNHLSLRNIEPRLNATIGGYRVSFFVEGAHNGPVAKLLSAAHAYGANVRIAPARKIGRPRKEKS